MKDKKQTLSLSLTYELLLNFKFMILGYGKLWTEHACLTSPQWADEEEYWEYGIDDHGHLGEDEGQRVDRAQLRAGTGEGAGQEEGQQA